MEKIHILPLKFHHLNLEIKKEEETKKKNKILFLLLLPLISHHPASQDDEKLGGSPPPPLPPSPLPPPLREGREGEGRGIEIIGNVANRPPGIRVMKKQKNTDRTTTTTLHKWIHL